MSAGVLAACVCWVAAAAEPGPARHTLVVHDSLAAVAGGAGTLRGRAAMLEGPAWLELRPAGAAAEEGDAAFYESAEVRPGPRDGAAGVFTEALISWNVAVPEACAVRIDVLARDAATAEWSVPLFIGSWVGPGGGREALPEGERRQKTDTGIVIDVDYLRSARPLDALRYRLTAVRSVAGERPGEAVRVRRVAVCFSDTRGPNEAGDGDFAPARRGRLGVPFRSQKTDDESLAGRLCSPTSVSMVLAHRGVDVPVQTVAARALDPNFGIYGNWPRNVQTAYALGVPGYLTRLNSWAELARLTDAGHPVVISIAVEAGELRGAPYESTAGHLIVVEGFDDDGNVLVNDPAVADAAQGQRAYRREDLTNVWLRRVDGTAYVLLGREGAP